MTFKGNLLQLTGKNNCTTHMKRILNFKKKTPVLVLALSSITFFHSAIAQNNGVVDTTTIERFLGMKGKINNGEYKITIPQNDLSVEVDGFKIIPAMGLSTWVAFTPTKDGVMFMGDLVVTETDLKAVQQEIIKQGLTSTAIHNHFVRNHPNIIFMHMGGSGSTELMAQKAKAVLDR
jgi:hypothetical protein